MVTFAAYLVYFLVLTAAVTLVTALIRLEKPKHIAVESVRFLVSIAIGILVLCLIVAALGWLFV